MKRNKKDKINKKSINKKNKRHRKIKTNKTSACKKITALEFIKILLRGFSQVMLQNNIWTGLLFMIGIFWNSWLMGIGALIGTFIGTLTGFALKYEYKDIKKGYYGFNGVLVGIAVFFFFKPTIISVLFLIAGVIASSIIMNFMHSRNLYPYTFPFVLSAWILIVIIKGFSLAPAAVWQVYGLSDSLNSSLSAIAMGFGQVMFQASIITGIIFFIAILINSRITAAYALGGALIGALTAYLLSFSPSLIITGIFGFNGVLCGIAFAEKKWQSIIWALIAVALSVFIIFGMITYGLIALTFPFVLATWIVLGIQHFLSKNKAVTVKKR